MYDCIVWVHLLCKQLYWHRHHVDQSRSPPEGFSSALNSLVFWCDGPRFSVHVDRSSIVRFNDLCVKYRFLEVICFQIALQGNNQQSAVSYSEFPLAVTSGVFGRVVTGNLGEADGDIVCCGWDDYNTYLLK